MTRENERLFEFDNLRRAFYVHFENYTPDGPWEMEQPFRDLLDEEKLKKLDQYVSVYNEGDVKFMQILYSCGIQDGIRLGKALKELDRKSRGPL